MPEASDLFSYRARFLILTRASDWVATMRWVWVGPDECSDNRPAKLHVGEWRWVGYKGTCWVWVQPTDLKVWICNY